MALKSSGASFGRITRTSIDDWFDVTEDWTLAFHFQRLTSGGAWLGTFGPVDFTTPYVNLYIEATTNLLYLSADDFSTQGYQEVIGAVINTSAKYAYLVYNSTAHTLKLYIDLVLYATLSYNLDGLAIDEEWWLSNTSGIDNNSVISYIRLWQGIKTLAEMTLEKVALQAVSTTDLLSDNPLYGPAYLRDISGNKHHFSSTGSPIYSASPLTIPTFSYDNILSPTEISSLPTVIVGTFGGLLTKETWFKFTNDAYVIIGNNYFESVSGDAPQVTSWTVPDTTTTDPSGAGVVNKPSQFPVADDTAYYWRILPGANGSLPIILEINPPPNDSYETGDILIPDDMIGQPSAIISGTTGELLRFVRAIDSVDDAAGDTGTDGTMVADLDQTTKRNVTKVQIIAPNLDVTTFTNPNSPTKNTITIDADGYIYLAADKSSGANVVVRKYGRTGVATGDTWNLGSNDVTSIAVNPGGTILYWAHSGVNVAVKRWDLTNNIAMADIVVALALYSVKIIVLTDGTFIVHYKKGSTDSIFKHYTAAGVLSASSGALTGAYEHMIMRDTDDTHIRAWLQTATQSVFKTILVSSMAVTSSVSIDAFNDGIGPVGSDNFFGPSFSCPAFVLRSGAGADTGIYYITDTKKHDTLWDSGDDPIPTPFAQLAYIGDE